MSIDKTKFDDRQLIELIYDDVADLKKKLQHHYATKEQVDNAHEALDDEDKRLSKRIDRVEKALLWAVGIVLTTVIVSVLGVVLT